MEGSFNLWHQLVEYARWTPSPHNVQPWRLRIVDGQRAELLYDPARLLRATDPTSSFTIAGLSMFIESLRIAAAPLGFEVRAEHEKEARLDYDTKVFALFATLTLEKSKPHSNVDPNLLLQRRTSRGWYRGRALEAAAQERLVERGSAFGHTVSFSSDANFVNRVVNLNRETLFLDLDDEASRLELSRWIRTSARVARLRPDGLWSKCMKFPGWVMHLFFHHHRLFHPAILRSVLGKLYTLSMRGTATVLWIEGPFSNREDWVRGGKMLLHLWVEMTRLGLVMHPFGSVVTNKTAHAKFTSQVRADRPDDGDLWLLARIGMSSTPPRSLRLESTDIFVP